MLKWAVYGKKAQDGHNFGSQGLVHSDDEGFVTNAVVRRSLDAPAIKKSKKPSRYQRRSLGSGAIRRNSLRNIDKENINYIGSTPNYYKEGFQKKSEGLALKDVSNITPTHATPVKNFEMRRFYLNGSKDDIPPDLPPTPPTYSQRIREAKKRKLETTKFNHEIYDDNFNRSSETTKSERRLKSNNGSKLSHSTSEPSLHELTGRLSESLNKRNSIAVSQNKCHPISTTRSTADGLVEIEYDEDLVLNCIEKPILNKSYIEKSTLPIFGHHIFMNNPLYFNQNESGLNPLKRTRKRSNEFESSFKSPTVDKTDVHTLVRNACSPVSVTPLSAKLSALRFSTMSIHSKSQIVQLKHEVSEFFPKITNPFSVPLRDEETSNEMENKFILSKDSVDNVTESTVSTTQMGDITLERMIEDIIKSTKIVKSRRRILKNENQSPITVEATAVEAKELFVHPQTETKVALIKEAKYVNLSRENSISPKNTPVKNREKSKSPVSSFVTKMNPVLRVSDKLLKNVPIGGFILDDGDGYNEREVRTPDNFVQPRPVKNTEQKLRNLNRSQSMNAATIERRKLAYASSESTPDIFGASQDPNRLKRQRCIRRKKSTVSNDSKIKLLEPKSMLTLEVGLPSPSTELPNVSLTRNTPVYSETGLDVSDSEYSSLKHSASFKSIASHSSVVSHELNNEKKSKELFGLTLDNGIPSPITPVTNLKRPRSNLSEERAHKTSKLDEDVMDSDIVTPVLEHKSTRRCLRYSPDEGSIDSFEEKRRSVASNKSERSGERWNHLKGTIDLEVVTKNDIVDVHVIRCRDLQKPCGKSDDINAYAKVVISGLTENQTLPSQRSIFQRTSVLYGKREPEFQRHLKLPLPKAIYDNQVLHISVWHRDKKYRRSEFLGCVSFPLKDVITSDTAGTYFLQSQVSGRAGAIEAGLGSSARSEDRCARPERVTTKHRMATDNIDGSSTNEEPKENHNENKGSNGGVATGTPNTVAAALQKEAEEHLFLRYLELDPPEDPNAPRKTQRQGRTPFTTTRKLSRGTSGGFGFTVVWTRPPRVERVAAGGSAERAGLRAGDYIVFVGNKNVVTSGEEEVRGLVKSSGQILNLETFRRVPQNGVGATRPRLAQVNIQPLATEMTPPTPRSPRAAPQSPAPAARPPTACSSTSQSLDRRKLHLPQVTFSKEVGNGIIV